MILYMSAPVVIQHRPIYPQRVMIIWTKFLPYHIARIKHLKKRLDEIGCALTAVEVASQDELYPFGKNFEIMPLIIYRALPIPLAERVKR